MYFSTVRHQSNDGQVMPSGAVILTSVVNTVPWVVTLVSCDIVISFVFRLLLIALCPSSFPLIGCIPRFPNVYLIKSWTFTFLKNFCFYQLNTDLVCVFYSIRLDSLNIACLLIEPVKNVIFELAFFCWSLYTKWYLLAS